MSGASVRPGDLVEDPDLGRGMVIYLEGSNAILAHPENPEMVISKAEDLEVLCNLSEVTKKRNRKARKAE